MARPVKTRFAPAPTGYLHVGGARTALFNWLYARKHGGTFLLRIEDTDRARHVEGAVDKIVEDLRWLGIDWDEGYGVGGPGGPYRQSQRLEMYREYLAGLLAAGRAYYAFETPQELEGMRQEARAAKRPLRYPRPAETPTDPAEAQKARAAGRPVVVRFKVPGRDVTVHDEVFGDVTIAAAEQEDFIILKDDGFPTFHLANVVDDGLMGVTLAMRGQEFLGQTWRQVLLCEALGLAGPSYAHLPLILDMAGRKLSKRDRLEAPKGAPEGGAAGLPAPVDVHAFRAEGYLPEALMNFIALLGWSPGDDRERMTRAELIESFSLERLARTNARFDPARLLAFNTEAAAEADPDRLLSGLRDYLSLNPDEAGPMPADDEDMLGRLLRANKGFRTFADIVAKSRVLFVADDAFQYDEKAVKKVLLKGGGAGFAMLGEIRPCLTRCEWTEQALKALIEGVCREKSVGMSKVAQPIRVAVTGTTISPSIYETLLILGKDKALARIDRCLALRSPARP